MVTELGKTAERTPLDPPRTTQVLITGDDSLTLHSDRKDPHPSSTPAIRDLQKSETYLVTGKCLRIRCTNPLQRARSGS
jgi:hypothetical protein